MKREKKDNQTSNKQVLEGLARWRKNDAHANGPGAPAGNTNALRHGVFADRYLEPDEKVLFDAIIGALNQDFKNNGSSDLISVELVGINMVKLGRAYATGDMKAAEALDAMLRHHLRNLKALKISREGEKSGRDQGTPADWATSLLEKIESNSSGASGKAQS